MKWHSGVAILALIILAPLVLPSSGSAADDDYVKWYGVGGEINGQRRWLGRIGISEYLGTEVIFAMKHMSRECGHSDGDCDSTTLDVGAGVIYEIAPGAAVAPYLAGRFILTMTSNGDSETSGTVESAGGVEYLIRDRIGVSGELNFRFRTDPTEVVTSTVVRFYFYF
jgi:hypothetical protein